MSYQQVFRPDLNLVYCRFGPTITIESARECVLTKYQDSRYQPGMRELADFRAVTDVDRRFDYASLHDLWETQGSTIHDLQQQSHLVLVSSTDLVYGLVRIYAALATRTYAQVTPCRDWREACEELLLPPDTVFLDRAAEV